jgi:hypothetical protein
MGTDTNQGEIMARPRPTHYRMDQLRKRFTVPLAFETTPGGLVMAMLGSCVLSMNEMDAQERRQFIAALDTVRVLRS